MVMDDLSLIGRHFASRTGTDAWTSKLRKIYTNAKTIKSNSSSNNNNSTSYCNRSNVVDGGRVAVVASDVVVVAATAVVASVRVSNLISMTTTKVGK